MKCVDEKFELLGCGFLAGQLEKLAGQFGGVRESAEIEFVHQSRVASRRLRAGLEVFGGCFGKKEVKRWEKAIRKVTRSLGAARDLDVQAAWLEKRLVEIGESSVYWAGVDRLLMRLRQRRSGAQDEIVGLLDWISKEGVLNEMYGTVCQKLFRLQCKDLTSEDVVLCEARGRIRERLGSLLEMAGCLEDSGDVGGHHRMRICAKRLRYTMEIFRELFGPSFKDFIKGVKRVQSLLGDLHDCDVWGQGLEKFIVEEQKRTEAYFGDGGAFDELKAGLEYLVCEEKKRRESLFGEMLGIWGKMKEELFWEGFSKIVVEEKESVQEGSEDGEKGLVE